MCDAGTRVARGGWATYSTGSLISLNSNGVLGDSYYCYYWEIDTLIHSPRISTKVLRIKHMPRLSPMPFLGAASPSDELCLGEHVPEAVHVALIVRHALRHV